MADTNLVNKQQKQPGLEKNKADPSKFSSHFLFKAVLLAIFLVVIQNIPSQAPEFINQTLLNRGWELIHLLFVGIAVSYGLFSRRNDENEKESNNKFDSAQSYVSRLLQVSPVFDEESINASGSDQESKFHTWSNQYYRNEAVVMVAQDNNSVVDKQNVKSSEFSVKPLLLPVRSLKSRVVPDTDESCGNPVSSIGKSNSSSGSRRFSRNSSRKTRNCDPVDVGFQDDVKENVVLPSPIPWRSRSGKLEIKEGIDGPGMHNLPASMEESEFTRSFKSQPPRLSRQSSTISSPKLSPSESLSSPRKVSSPPLVSSDLQDKIMEDSVRKKSYYSSAPPPAPPPPPPPPMIYKSSSMKPSSSLIAGGVSFEKELRRTFTSDSRVGTRNLGADFKPKLYIDASSMGKSVRTRADNSFGRVWKDEENDNGWVMNGMADKKEKEVEPYSTEKPGRKTVTFNQTEFWSNESGFTSPRPTFREYPREEMKEYAEEVIVDTDEESENEYDQNGRERHGKNEEFRSTNAPDEAPDVDKKADEFIAKFREQIRLQRIESFKRSSGKKFSKVNA